MDAQYLVDRLGPLGVFLFVFLSHLIPLISLPGYLATVLYAAYANDSLHQALAVLATAAGATLGKVAVFLYGYGIGKAVAGEELDYARRLFQKVSKWGVDLAVFIFAVTPLTDDVLYIPLGAAGYDVRRFVIPLFLGKLLLSIFIVAFADATLAALGVGNGWAALAVLAAVTVAATALVLRIKWSKVLEAYEREGVRGAARVVVKSIIGRV
ncbi:MAG: VTT domain-containing protein [Pyrobaculum sp.]